MKLVFGIITFNGDFFLKQVLESIYPFAHKICIAEGPVKYWQEQGFSKSADNTHDIIYDYPDPYRIIECNSNRFEEKDDQCRGWFQLIPPDTDYIICVDDDEVHRPEDIETLIKFLEKEQPTSVGFKSDSFFGGFDRTIGGFEKDHSFKRVLKYLPGCIYDRHRQPTLSLNGNDIAGKDISGNQLYEETGITMWHGSYISPKRVHDKIKYYETSVIAPGSCVPNFFIDVYLSWVTQPERRAEIENKNRGVHEFAPHVRGDTFTEAYTKTHPTVILRDMLELKRKFREQLMIYV